jgi:asparagine synthase (glutamine-hydrolysing)
MSGFVVGFGHPDRRALDVMVLRMNHRGPYRSGICDQHQAMMAQNYLKADFSSGQEPVHQIPVTSPRHEAVRIVYDGQIGNVHELAQQGHLPAGPFLEERVVLSLYHQHGPEMFQSLHDAIFAFVISDGQELLAARDLLGIKTLFYGWQEETLYLASELKSLMAVTEDVHEFPPGHAMDRHGRFTCFGTVSELPTDIRYTDEEEIEHEIRDIIQRSVQHRVNFAEPTACLLSGGMDSSVIGYVASHLYKQTFGKEARLPTFAIGVGASHDIRNARIMAEHIDAEHHELIVTPNQVLKVLPDVIYQLESFDPSLVRSAASNFLISQYAKQQGMHVLLSGEGGDEVFCGYSHLKNVPPEALPDAQITCLGSLHNNAALRLDRMNQCHSIQVIAPLISGELLHYALHLPPQYKVRTAQGQTIEKWIFRKAFAQYLPDVITWRTKQEFSQGSGSADFLSRYFEDVISDAELAEAQAASPIIRSKEELWYFRLFTQYFKSDLAVKTVGQWISL